MLGGGGLFARPKIWRASLWLSASCVWSCWSYSQPRTGLVNRLPGIVSNRTPLAHVPHIIGGCQGAPEVSVTSLYFGVKRVGTAFVTLEGVQMKRNGDWRAKLDPWGLEFLEGCHKANEIRGKVKDSNEWHAMMQEIAAQHPQISGRTTVDVTPEFIKLLFESNHLSEIVAQLKPTAGQKILPSPMANFVEVMQGVTTALEEPDMRVAAGFLAGLLRVILGGIYEDLSQRQFGDEGPKETKDYLWLAGTTLEMIGKGIKKGKIRDVKGKVNIEFVQLIKIVREHQTAKLTYRELQEALEYAGVHFSDEDSFRVFEWRARKRGWMSQNDKTRSSAPMSGSAKTTISES